MEQTSACMLPNVLRFNKCFLLHVFLLTDFGLKSFCGLHGDPLYSHCSSDNRRDSLMWLWIRQELLS